MRVEDHQSGLLALWFEFKGVTSLLVDLKDFPFDECRLEVRLTGGRLRDGVPSSKEEFVLHDSPPPDCPVYSKIG